MIAPRAVVIDPARRAGVRTLIETLALGPSRAVHGVVRDGAGQPVPGARVLPCLLDEVFGRLAPLVPDEAAARTDAGGWFALTGLPVELGPYQQLIILILHGEHGAVARPLGVPPGVRAGPESLEIEIERLQRTLFEGYAAGRSFQVADTVAGLGSGVVLRVRTVRTDARGRALLPRGDRTRWVRGAGHEPWSGLLRDASGSWRPVTAPRGPVVDGEHYRLGVDHLLFRGGVRHAAPHRFAGAVRIITIADSLGRAARGIEMFAEGAGGLHFLGIYDGLSPAEIALPLADGWRLVALGPEGALGRLDLVAGPGSAVVALGAPARVLWNGPAAALLTFEDGAGSSWWRAVVPGGLSAPLLTGTWTWSAAGAAPLPIVLEAGVVELAR